MTEEQSPEGSKMHSPSYRQGQDGGQQLSKIYTDWANHYLEKARSKYYINDLQQDMGDGVLLADIIEAVTSEKVQDIKSKPRNAAQMLDNINACLVFLSGLGVSVEGLSAKDIKDGNLKSILGLFFSLSRYKQQQKAQQSGNTGGNSRNSSNVNEQGQMISRLPSPYSKQSNKCPTVTYPSTKDSTTAGKSKTQGTRSSLNQQNNNITQGSRNNNASSGQETGSSRSTSPSSISGIPTPGGRSFNVSRSHSLSERHNHRIVNSTSTGSTSSSLASASSKGTTTSGYQTAGSSVSNYSSKSTPANKNSMLDKFKFFNSKDKSASKSGGGTLKGSSSKTAATKVVDNERSAPQHATSTGAAWKAQEAAASQSNAGAVLGDTKSSKSLKKTLRGALSSKREPSPKTGKEKETAAKQQSNPPSNTSRSVQQIQPNVQNSKSGGTSKSSPNMSQRVPGIPNAKSEKAEIKSGQNSPSLGKKSSKIAVPKSQQGGAIQPSVPTANMSKITASTGLNSPNTSVPMPVGIPKGATSATGAPSSSSKSTVSKSKEDKIRSASSHRESSKELKSASSQYSKSHGASNDKSNVTDIRYATADNKQQVDTRTSSKQSVDPRLNNNGTSAGHNETYSTGLNTRNYLKTGLGGDIGSSTSKKDNLSNKSAAYSQSKSHQSAAYGDQYSQNHNFSNSDYQCPVNEYDSVASLTHPNSRVQSPSGSSHYGSLKKGDRIQSPGGSRYYGSLKHGERVQSPGGSSHYGSLKHGEQIHSPSGSSHYGSLKHGERVQSPSSGSHYGSLKTGERMQSPGSGSHYGSLKHGERVQSPMGNTGSRNSDRLQSPSGGSQHGSTRSRDRSNNGQYGSLKNTDRHNTSSSSKSSVKSGNYGSLKSEHSSSNGHSVKHSESASRTSNSVSSTGKSERKSDRAANPQKQSPTKPERTSSMPNNANKAKQDSKRTTASANENRSKSNGTDSQNNHSGTSSSTDSKSEKSVSSTESVIYKPASDSESAASTNNKQVVNNAKKTSSTAGNETEVGGAGNKYMKNTFPKSKEKMETTFDAEVRTETVTVPDEPSPEVMDIKPMQPILRSSPYTGYLRSITGNKQFSGPLNSNYGSSRGFQRQIVPESAKYFQLKRAGMNNCTNSMIDSTDYGSDAENFDISGYMSDGDILRGNHIGADDFSGYMSEGGASLYARRMQQRFREGMQAVQECMQKSAALTDDDSFDDSSSISSGDISDTIGDISTDENLTGTSQSASCDYHNPYGNLKHKDTNLAAKVGYYGAKTAFIGNKNLNVPGSDYDYTAWRKYSVPDDGHNYVSLDYTSEPDTSTLHRWYKNDLKGGNYGTKGSMRRNSNIEHSYASSENLSRQSNQRNTSNKVDSETNTDQSIVMMQKQHQRSASLVHSSPVGMNSFGFRRPMSGASAGSLGSSKSTSSTSMRAQIGTKPVDLKSSSPYSKPSVNPGKISPSKSGLSSRNSPEDAYKSNTLGRRRPEGSIKDHIFGSRSNINKVPAQSSGETMCMNTIISNPHATLTKKADGQQIRHSPSSDYTGLQSGNFSSAEYMAHHHGRPLSGSTCSPQRLKPGKMSLSETESMESISSVGLNVQAQIQQARAHGLASRNILAQNRESYTFGTDRTNTMRSTKSDRMYQSLSQSFDETLSHAHSFGQIPCSEVPAPVQPPPNQAPLSPTGSVSSQSSSRFTYPMTALGPSGSSHNLVHSNSQQMNNNPYGIMYPRDEDGLHSSQLSLASNSSSVYSTSNEEKQALEIRKLRRELDNAQDKVVTLSTQLSTNAHVVAAFEQSLSNMTTRLQSLTHTAEQKDSELYDLRTTVDTLRSSPRLDMLLKSSNYRKASTLSGPASLDQPSLTRHLSSESMTSLNSMSSTSSMTSQQSAATDVMDASKKSKANKKGGSWLRSSLGKAFSKKKKNRSCSVSDIEPDNASMSSDIMMAPYSPLLHGGHATAPGTPIPQLKSSHSSSGYWPQQGHSNRAEIFRLLGDKPEDVRKLQKALDEKDAKLTDIRLEALSSAHQLEHLKETMMKMKNEMSVLKCDNQRLQHIVTHSNPCSPEHTLSRTNSESHHDHRSITDSLEKRLSLDERLSNIEFLMNDNEGDGRRINITVYTGNMNDIKDAKNLKHLKEILIGSMCINGKVKWDLLDSIVKRAFKDYCLRVDSSSCLGLDIDSVLGYHIGEIVRDKDITETPELLPCGYLVGEDMQIQIGLKGTYQMSIDSLAFETLIPKSIIQRYVSLLVEHRRIILCGPSGTGKSYLAQKLGEYLVHRSGKKLSTGAIATFNVDHKSSKELRQYLTNIADQCENSNSTGLPSVIILDNLHHVGSLGEVFNGFLSCKYQKCPYIIGTMNQATCATTNLQLHHNFRWVLCANHMEPVKGFLGRYLRRKLIEKEITSGERINELTKVADWIPQVWQHLNKFLETHSSSDVTIGPRLFLSCPMDISGSQVWFTDLWNYSIVPYLLEAVREGIQMYGKRAAWVDPTDWVMETYPWMTLESQDWPSLLKLRPADVGYDTQGMISIQGALKPTPPTQAEGDGDPLLNMLMRLQEAASYSSPQSNESDSVNVVTNNTSDTKQTVQSSSASVPPSTQGGSIESTI